MYSFFSKHIKKKTLLFAAFSCFFSIIYGAKTRQQSAPLCTSTFLRRLIGTAKTKNLSHTQLDTIKKMGDRAWYIFPNAVQEYMDMQIPPLTASQQQQVMNKVWVALAQIPESKSLRQPKNMQDMQ